MRRYLPNNVRLSRFFIFFMTSKTFQEIDNEFKQQSRKIQDNHFEGKNIRNYIMKSNIFGPTEIYTVSHIENEVFEMSLKLRDGEEYNLLDTYINQNPDLYELSEDAGNYRFYNIINTGIFLFLGVNIHQKNDILLGLVKSLPNNQMWNYQLKRQNYDFSKIVKYFFIPDNISVISYMENEKMNQIIMDFGIEYTENTRLEIFPTPTFTSITLDYNNHLLFFTDWFYLAYPDVVKWFNEIPRDKTLNYFNVTESDITNNNIDRNFNLFRIVIDKYKENYKLECAVK